jgi:hypothetical protein
LAVATTVAMSAAFLALGRFGSRRYLRIFAGSAFSVSGDLLGQAVLARR